MFKISLCSVIFLSFSCSFFVCVFFVNFFGMDRAETNKNNSTAIPAAFRGLQVLLVDNNTETLLKTGLILEGYSYKGTKRSV